MIHSPKIVWMPILAATLAALLLPTNLAAQNAQIRHIAVVRSGAGTEIQIETTKRLLPLTQIITDPDRLIIDFPDAVPGPQLHTVAVSEGAVKSVRAALFSANPAMTRIVIDLKSSQDFELVPTGKAVTVKFRGDPSVASTPAASTSAPAPPQPVRQAVAVPAAPVPTATPAPAVPKPPAVSAAVRPTITIERVPVATQPPLTEASVVTSSNQLPVAPASVVSASLPAPEAPTGSQPAQIRRVAVLKSGGATEIEIETSQRVVPTTQLITGPDRLVLDFAGSLPGPALRALAVNQGEVRGVRTGLLSSRPPVTRVVLDLKSPQQFQLFPSAKAVVVKLPGSISASATPATVPAPPVPDSAPAAEIAPPPPPPKKVVSSFQDGLLSLTSKDGSLADVLDEIREQTGADIAVPAGAEQEKVAASLGPASPRDVLTQLLNGSRYNFIIVGSDSDANKVDRVILSLKSAADMAVPSEAAMPEPVPVAQATPPVGSVSSVRAAAPPPPVPPPDQAQPQGDSNPPPDTTPQPGDPQPAPN
jgi:hypothetical protein